MVKFHQNWVSQFKLQKIDWLRAAFENDFFFFCNQFFFRNPNGADDSTSNWPQQHQINSFALYWPPFDEQQQQYLSICKHDRTIEFN